MGNLMERTSARVSLHRVPERLVVSRWRDSGCCPGTIQNYLRWLRRFRSYCMEQAVSIESQLTRAGAVAFVRTWARDHHESERMHQRTGLPALRALGCALRSLGQPVPRWREPAKKTALPALLREFVEYRRQHAGVADTTIAWDLQAVALLRTEGRDGTTIKLCEIDHLITVLSRRLARKTVARICCAFRAWFRFLYTSGRIQHDLASSILAPRIVVVDRPPRALPWHDVQRILKGIDLHKPHGQRDFAMLLLMATYGMGAGEVLSLRLEDVEWQNKLLHVHRPKTKVSITLPLLDPVAKALALYVRSGRPRHAVAREIFVSAHMPHPRLTASSAVWHRLQKHAREAGVVANFLGSHVLRHSHAMRQIELGANPKIVSDILGHLRPSSTSAYVRVATRRLRSLALPVPR